MSGLRLIFGLLAAVILLSLEVGNTRAQDDSCAALVSDVLDTVLEVCQGSERNSACYGSVRVDADPRDGAQEFTFETVGDRVPVAAIDRLDLAALDEEDGTWGIVLLRLQAVTEDTLPGENIIFVAFGDVRIDNEIETPLEAPLIRVEAVRGVNLRASPSDDAAIIGGLQPGDQVTADARTNTGGWLRIQWAESETAWLWAANVTALDGDLNSLIVIDPQVIPPRPMQAFRLRTSLRGPACDQAPPDGVMIQSPVDTRVTFTVNSVEIELGSTIFLQAGRGVAMRVYVIEGQARVTADGGTAYVPAGTFTIVPLGDDLEPVDRPGALQAYDNDELAALPVSLLDREIIVAEALTDQEIASALARTSSQQAAAEEQIETVTVPSVQNPAPSAVTSTEWRSRPSDPPCQTGGDFVCIRFSDGYYWLYNSAQFGAVLGWESDTYNGQPVEVAVLTSGYRLAHVLNTDLARGPY